MKVLEHIAEQDLEYIDLHENLAGLSVEQLNDLIDRYYSGEKLKSIASDYKVPMNNAAIADMLPPVLTDKVCPNCNNRIAFPRPRRTFLDKDLVATCTHCSHVEARYCWCDACKENSKLEKIRLEQERAEKEKKKREIIEASFKLSLYSPVSESDLTFKDILFLSTLLRAGLDEKMERIQPPVEYEASMTPSTELTVELLQYLTHRKLIVPTPESDLGAFPEKDEEHFPFKYYIYHVIYRLNIDPIGGDEKSLVQRLLYPDGNELLEQRDIALEMWKTISLHECLAYLVHSLNKVGYPFSPGEKTVAVFEELLNHFSVAQIYGIIYKSIANATKYEKETNINKKHAANLVVNNCERYGEKAIAENWRITNYRRDFNLPETIISKVLFDRILKISSLGFSEVPTKNY
ncbi:hypothetical protein FHE72_23415 (plasmid) [Rossellomorea vietnamensis]|uniref:Uncharacterized protein n=1 Tax=Rossellomorea vietnamensis TaxID=218284 RepID=A0A6I6UWU0_9BACI|nr:hypothetical protein [Rossellomorea vietnamensis]QHE63943.1 hypothetical protein FHE72_23415 [Rossellomorea vietnamensis]